jgi:alpha/beta superfamily hydrolase
MDAEAALNYVLERKDLSNKIVLFGKSLGGAVAIQLAASKKDKVRRSCQRSLWLHPTPKILIAGRVTTV